MNRFIEKAQRGNNQWYHYLFTALITFVAIQFGGIPLVIYALIQQAPQGISLNASIDIYSVTNTNIGLALMLLPFVAGFFSLLLCAKYIHKKNYLDVITGRERFDWRRFFYGAGVWAILGIFSTLITLVFTNDASNIVFQFEPVNFFFLVLIAVLLLPFQTAFEEIAFRGYLIQGCALVFKSKWAALIISSLAFGLMHGSNPEVKEFGFWIAMPQYILMGLFMGYVALKDEGLELAIGIHAANNILTAITFTSDASALQTHSLFKIMDPTASIYDTLSLAVFAAIFIIICNRKYHFNKKKTVEL
ncbi:CPBP family intramembrane metalloprotease [Odoribacter sp. OttesenSCG-928-A06]|nr:CPBP family intramembrane metalloprotease [Odoribacter sp. OttesenSCG-928-A06]